MNEDLLSHYKSLAASIANENGRRFFLKYLERLESDRNDVTHSTEPEEFLQRWLKELHLSLSCERSQTSFSIHVADLSHAPSASITQENTSEQSSDSNSVSPTTSNHGYLLQAMADILTDTSVGEHLHALTLRRCGLSGLDNFKILVQILKNCHCLKVLDLSGNTVDLEVVKLLATTMQETCNQTLETLRITDAQFDDSSLLQLLPLLQMISLPQVAPSTSSEADDEAKDTASDTNLQSSNYSNGSESAESTKLSSSTTEDSANGKASNESQPSASLESKALTSSLNLAQDSNSDSGDVGNVRVRGGDSLSKSSIDPVTVADAPVGRTRGRTITGSLPFLRKVALEVSACRTIEKSKRFQVGCAETTGRRNDMQDTTLIYGCFRGKESEDLFAVFDGHGTKDSAVYASEHFATIFARILTAHEQRCGEAPPDSAESKVSVEQCLTEAFLEMQNAMRPWAIHNGTTAAVTFIQDDTVYVANVGDTRAVLCRSNQAVRLSVDHKADLPEEVKRVQELGGEVRNGRVNGVLAVSRALGDSFLDPYVSAVPFVSTTKLTPEDTFLILACDGLFDIFADETAVAISKNEKDPEKQCQRLRDQAFLSGSTDNISVVVLRFN